MPVLVNTVLQDRAAVPANHTFVPVQLDGGVGALENKGVTFLGNERLTMAFRRTPGGRLKSTERLAIPIVVNETINGVTVPKLQRVGYAKVEFDFDVSSTEQERKDVVGMTMSSLDVAKLFSELTTKAEAIRS